eukprot:CAMPEP_0169255418 /NCGR_PEP_ID=MMETSP1016-20121227/39715_1 /TAXON_ID=342587 /ORGANISM="Karlodinium micrum, Strain CCMP2283" /LENGTH=219 /DNA_ID=CAMNT_0009336979 /DNA_START=223 /DNA_END=880 /DNA_ORIENTATION=+
MILADVKETGRNLRRGPPSFVLNALSWLSASKRLRMASSIYAALKSFASSSAPTQVAPPLSDVYFSPCVSALAGVTASGIPSMLSEVIRKPSMFGSHPLAAPRQVAAGRPARLERASAPDAVKAFALARTASVSIAVEGAVDSDPNVTVCAEACSSSKHGTSHSACHEGCLLEGNAAREMVSTAVPTAAALPLQHAIDLQGWPAAMPRGAQDAGANGRL